MTYRERGVRPWFFDSFDHPRLRTQLRTACQCAPSLRVNDVMRAVQDITSLTLSTSKANASPARPISDAEPCPENWYRTPSQLEPVGVGNERLLNLVGDPRQDPGEGTGYTDARLVERRGTARPNR